MSRYSRRRKYCRFTAEGITEIDYKDLNLLKAYVTETGKAALPVPRLTTSVSWHRQSSEHVFSLCCRTPTATRRSRSEPRAGDSHMAARTSV